MSYETAHKLTAAACVVIVVVVLFVFGGAR